MYNRARSARSGHTNNHNNSHNNHSNHNHRIDDDDDDDDDYDEDDEVATNRSSLRRGPTASPATTTATASTTATTMMAAAAASMRSHHRPAALRRLSDQGSADETASEPEDVGEDFVKDGLVTPEQEMYTKEDPALSFFYSPHTMSFLFCLLALGLYVALYMSETEDIVTNTKLGLVAAASVFMMFGVIQFRDGPFSRPHPAFWRLIQALSIEYLLFLVFLLFQNVDDARRLFTYYNPNLNTPLPERSYAENCDLSWKALWNQMDEFVLAHSLGWFGKALVLRDPWCLWIISVLFEIMEYSLSHQMPNFKECWWDHWILDVLCCNALGIVLGLKTVRYFEGKTYDWRGWNQIPTKRGKLSRAVQQFTPASWDVFEWGATKTLKRWLFILLVICLFLQLELNGFYLKAILWFPPTESLNVYRLLLLFLMGLPGVREGYQFIADKQSKRLGTQGWLLIACIQMESLVCLKLGRHLFQQEAPYHIKVGWAIFLSLLVAFTFFRFSPVRKLGRFLRGALRRSRQEQRQNFLAAASSSQSSS